jgi:hypothetical protein
VSSATAAYAVALLNMAIAPFEKVERSLSHDCGRAERRIIASGFLRAFVRGAAFACIPLTLV